ncbi:hypothetical protein L3556_03340 [Candidatus Synechococcus calcipolaris G9]|uniref:Uncharacterized protein n=1 Tax=Candidatus Synechococcus calcipolaris G9 TaxID=1497997 RepID=A0ABT6EW10_9SYNE|nr:hypothetical protein [Candidatus Synechococcus calcipolaris]MDG2989971.1 hypothetical protein [Candidatus Synechococcus calcipolaris G9]
MLLDTSCTPDLMAPDTVSMGSLAQAWAKRYIQNLDSATKKEDDPTVVSQNLLAELRNASVQAWQRTEGFLSQEMIRHGIASELVDPWEISKDIHATYQKTLHLYRDGQDVRRLAVKLGPAIGDIRRKYTATDPRVIGFVSMQFHHTGLFLLQSAPASQKDIVANYFKVIDDHLYMPLHRAYDAAAEQDYDSPALKLVRHLLPQSTEIARSICQRVIELYPRHRCYSGPLSQPSVRTSSIRDVEMFQIYLWVCLLEQKLDALQDELFPLCLMLYPSLNVNWELVYQMVHLMGKEFQERSPELDTRVLAPYYNALRQIFDPKIFQG